MENLEDFMRQKFDTDPDKSEARFEFREEYWEQAQALLEAEEARRRKKRRRWLFWWVFVGVVAVAVYSGSRQQSAEKSGSSSGTDSRQSAEKSGRDGSSWQEYSAVGDSTVGRLSGADDVQAQNGDTARGFVSGGKTLGADSVFLKNKMESQSGAPGQKLGARQEVFGKKEGNTRGVVIPERQTGKGNNVRESAPGNPPTLLSPNAETDSQKKGQPALDKEQVDNTPARSLADSANSPVVVAQDNFNDVSALPISLQLLELPARDLDTPFVTPFVRLIKPVREQKFSFGLAAAGTLSQASPDGKRLGGVGGVFAHYRFAPSWSLTTGANWRYLAGNWADDTMPSTSEQLRYSFGYQQDVWNQETQGVHFIEIPIGLRWQRGALAAEGGFAAGILLGVQGRLTHQHSESLQEGVTTTQSKVWLSKTPYYQFAPTAFLGGEWRATQQLGLTLRGTYHPSKIGKKLTDAPVPANVFWLDAGLRWYF